MAKNLAQEAGKSAVAKFGWLKANRFLLLRRLTQLSVLLAFWSGPFWGAWIFKGNLSASLLFNVVPLTDPLIAAQSLVAGYIASASSWIGLAVVVGFYALIAPRAFCAWVCPMNVVTDMAAWIRRKTKINTNVNLDKSIRYWFLAAILIGSAISGSMLWTWLDPVSALQRGLIYGFGAGIWLVVSVFIIDLLLIEHGWCGHLCPLGATYGLIGAKSVMRIKAVNRENCTKCMDCYNVCPEPQVLRQPLKSGDRRVMDKDCISCGRCIDVCSEQVFEFRNRIGPGDQENEK